MADLPPDTGTGRTTDTPPKAPRWVKITGIVVAILVVAFLVLKLAGVGGQHGPGRHGLGNEGRPAVVTAATTFDDSAYALTR